MRLDRTHLWDRDLVVRQDFQEQGFGFDFDAVDFVNKEHDWVGGPDRLEERPCQKERLGEDVRLKLLPGLILGGNLLGLDAKELLLVVPFVESLLLV